MTKRKNSLLLIFLLASTAWGGSVHIDGNFDIEKLLPQLSAKGIYAYNDGLHKPNAHIVYVSSAPGRIGSLDITFYDDKNRIPIGLLWASTTTMTTSEISVEMGKYEP